MRLVYVKHSELQKKIPFLLAPALRSSGSRGETQLLMLQFSGLGDQLHIPNIAGIACLQA